MNPAVCNSYSCNGCGFLKARWDFNTKIPCFFSLRQRCYEKSLSAAGKTPELNRAPFLEKGPAEVFNGNVIF